jgi:hypothetical protein
MNSIEQDEIKVVERMLVFLRAIGLNPQLRATMNAAGYCDEEHAKGWSLIAKTTGFVGGPRPPTKRSVDKLANWRDTGCHRLRKLLSVIHPEQEAFVFDGFDDSSDVVSTVAKLLGRLDALEGIGPEAEKRSGSESADNKAIALLDACGVGPELRRELRGHVATATCAEVSAEEVAAHDCALASLRTWYDHWWTIADLVFEKRGDRIKLGFEKPRRQTPAKEGVSRRRSPATSACVLANAIARSARCSTRSSADTCLPSFASPTSDTNAPCPDTYVTVRPTAS